jgi:hypothetical protein
MSEKAKKKNRTIPLSELMNSLFSSDSSNVEVTSDLFEGSNAKKSRRLQEYVIQVRVSGGTIVELKTGKFTLKAALREVPFAIRYCEEEFGKVLAWNWKGEDILYTPHSTYNNSFGQKILDYFGLTRY